MSPAAKKILKTTFALLSRSRLIRGLFRPYRGIGTILMYHRLRLKSGAPSDGFDPNGCLCVTPETFDAQLAFLKANYNCLGFDDFIFKLSNQTLPANAVTLTFDDGYQDNYTLAYPLLKKHGVPAMIYVTQEFPSGQAKTWWYDLEHVLRSVSRLDFTWQGQDFYFDLNSAADKLRAFDVVRTLFITLDDAAQQSLNQVILAKCDDRIKDNIPTLSWNEIRELDASKLISIGAHTVSHPVLKNLPENIAELEISISKKLIEADLGHSIKHFAYPFGSRLEAGPREFNLAKKTGFTSATTTRFGHIHPSHKDNLFALPRIPVAEAPLTDFAARLGGFEAAVRQRLKKVVLV